MRYMFELSCRKAVSCALAVTIFVLFNGCSHNEVRVPSEPLQPIPDSSLSEPLEPPMTTPGTPDSIDPMESVDSLDSVESSVPVPAPVPKKRKLVKKKYKAGKHKIASKKAKLRKGKLAKNKNLKRKKKTMMNAAVAAVEPLPPPPPNPPTPPPVMQEGPPTFVPDSMEPPTPIMSEASVGSSQWWPWVLGPGLVLSGLIAFAWRLRRNRRHRLVFTKP
ncbi:MAG: hypothetical protein AB7G93_13595 [Bdellovibrionales bacterium]